MFSLFIYGRNWLLELHIMASVFESSIQEEIYYQDRKVEGIITKMLMQVSREVDVK